MKYLLVLVFAAVATAQLGDFDSILQSIRDRLEHQNTHDDTIDTLHGWRLEDHKTDVDHLLLFINDQPDHRYCYVIKVAQSWESLLNTQENVYKITEEIYAIINDPNHRERPVRPGSLANDYHDFEAARECTGHATYSIRYTPSFA